MNIRLDKAKEILNEILSSDKYYFKDLVPSMLEENLEVVYAITNKETQEVLYVGRTKKLRRRLYTNHLHGNKANARLKKYLVEDVTLPEINTYLEAKQWMKEYCYFQYISIKVSRDRGHCEGLLGFLLDSKYIEEEH